MSTEADIVERLREKRGVLDNRWPGPSDLEKEAAAEIEELRAALDAFGKVSPQQYEKELAKLRAERDAAARDMRERAVKVAIEFSATGINPGVTMLRSMVATAVAAKIRALPDTPAVIATDGRDAT